MHLSRLLHSKVNSGRTTLHCSHWNCPPGDFIRWWSLITSKTLSRSGVLAVPSPSRSRRQPVIWALLRPLWGFIQIWISTHGVKKSSEHTKSNIWKAGKRDTCLVRIASTRVISKPVRDWQCGLASEAIFALYFINDRSGSSRHTSGSLIVMQRSKPGQQTWWISWQPLLAKVATMAAFVVASTMIVSVVLTEIWSGVRWLCEISLKIIGRSGLKQ